jgi:hypothetical protein
MKFPGRGVAAGVVGVLRLVKRSFFAGSAKIPTLTRFSIQKWKGLLARLPPWLFDLYA